MKKSSTCSYSNTLFIRIFCLLNLALFFQSCHHYTYSPSTVILPFKEEKNAVTITGKLGFPTFDNSQEAQLTYNPFKRFTIAASFFNGQIKYTDQEKSEGYRIQSVEGMAGGWLSAWSGNIRLGIFGGYGTGYARNFHESVKISNIRHEKIYLQPSFKAAIGKFRVGMGFRLVHLAFTKGNIDAAIPSEFLEKYQKLEPDSPLNLLESGASFGISLRRVGFYANLISAKKLGKGESMGTYLFDPYNASLGITFHINEFFKRKQPEIKG